MFITSGQDEWSLWDNTSWSYSEFRCRYAQNSAVLNLSAAKLRSTLRRSSTWVHWCRGINHGRQGDVSSQNLERGTLVQIVPNCLTKFCHVSKFQAQDWLLYNAVQVPNYDGDKSISTETVSLQAMDKRYCLEFTITRYFKRKKSFFSGEGLAPLSVPLPVEWYPRLHTPSSTLPMLTINVNVYATLCNSRNPFTLCPNRSDNYIHRGKLPCPVHLLLAECFLADVRRAVIK